MKKSILLGIAGLALAAGTSYGQGYIVLDNYIQNGSTLVNAGVTYGANVFANGVSGALGTQGSAVNSSWTVGIYFVTGTPSITDPAGTGIPIAPLALGTGAGSTAQVANAVSVNGTAGAFNAAPFNIGAAVGTAITYELVAYDTAGGSYANALFRGHSAPFTVTSVLNTAPTPAYTANAAGLITVSPTLVPEPTTLALAGLGGFGMLMALRRKQS